MCVCVCVCLKYAALNLNERNVSNKYDGRARVYACENIIIQNQLSVLTAIIELLPRIGCYLF